MRKNVSSVRIEKQNEAFIVGYTCQEGDEDVLCLVIPVGRDS